MRGPAKRVILLAVTTTSLMTEDELLQLPHGHVRHELVRGELRTIAPTGGDHGATVVNLTGPLWQHVKKHNLGRVFGAETGFTLEKNPDTVRAPDVAFVAAARIPAGGIPRKFVPGPPDLAAEVVSPSDTVHEVDDKVEAWLRAGARLVWVVNSKNRSVTVHALGRAPQILQADETLSGEDVLPGFALPVRDIFE